MDPQHAVAAFAGIPCTRAAFTTVEDIMRERNAQDVQWGQQDHEDGTGVDWDLHRDMAQLNCQQAFADGDQTWTHVLLEEVYEALAEDDPAKLRAELVQVAAVAAAWVEAIDRREADRG